jgi:hypothetical protein
MKVESRGKTNPIFGRWLGMVASGEGGARKWLGLFRSLRFLILILIFFMISLLILLLLIGRA